MAAAARSRFKYTLVIDADERLPSRFGAELRQLLAEQGHRFEALQLPFATYFANRRMVSISPYKAPSVFRTGRFFYNSRPHQGARVDGLIAALPADKPERFLPHFSYSSLQQYISKMNGYSSTEAANMRADGRTFHWREMVAHTVHDMKQYFEAGGGHRDGVHGLYYALFSGFYRIAQHGKLYEARYNAGELTAAEQDVPGSVEEFLDFALAVCRSAGNTSGQEMRKEGRQENALKQETRKQGSKESTLGQEDRKEGRQEEAVRGETAISAVGMNSSACDNEKSAFADSNSAAVSCSYGLRPTTYDLVYCAPFSSPSGYGEESRHNLFALHEAGLSVAARVLPWHSDGLQLSAEESEHLSVLTRKAHPSGRVIQLVQDFAPNFRHDPDASVSILRTMFETDRVPADWLPALRSADRIWVPSEFNRRTFARSGVPGEKIAVIPGCFDPAPYLAPAEPTALAQEIRASGRFTFLFVGEWCTRKGWHALLTAFIEAFAGRADVALVIRTWSSIGLCEGRIKRSASQYCRLALDHDVCADARVRFVTECMSRAELIALYRACDAFILPTFGEGWGRPYMEAMASGLPAIGIDWGGSASYMTPENSYLVRTKLVPVPLEGYAPAPGFKGHRWAEIDMEDLKQTMLRVAAKRSEAAAIGARAQEEVCAKFNRAAVGAMMRQEIERLMG
jgi:glycosyltransferase involved in cell wall biosynthesis